MILLCYLCFITAANGLKKINEFQRYDGWYNNLAHADWGSVGSKLYRLLPSNYSDGVYMLREDLPSPRRLSDLVFKGSDGLRNERNMTTMLAFFSQVVAYEILQSSDASCPLEMHKIKIPKGDAIFDSEGSDDVMMPFTRARYDKGTGAGLNSPREQINEKTAWIDASFLYSTQEPWVAAMRSYVNGTLKEGDMPDYPPLNEKRIPLINPPPPQIHRLMDPERLFLLGEPRVNENPGLLSFGLIFYRWHNRRAKKLQELHPDWSDNHLFNGARRWVIATLQNIVMYEFLPGLLNDPDPLGPYSGYHPSLPSGISHIFAAAAFRFPHTLIPPGMFLRKATSSCEFQHDVAGYPAVRLCQNWWNAQDIISRFSVENVVLGMASQIAEREDRIVVSDLRDYVFGPMHFSRLDLVALGIMRGRDNGLPNYNAVRKEFKLPIRHTWAEINPQLFATHPHIFEELSVHYNGSIDNLDLYVGGMLESNGRGPGPLFAAIIKEQFRRIRDADRFWFENTLNGIFTREEIEEVKSWRLSDIIKETTEIRESQIQRDVFFWREGDPCRQPYHLSSHNLEPCIPFMRHDHFMGNEVTFIFTCIALAIIPIVCAGIAYLITSRRRKNFASFNYMGAFPLNNAKIEELTKHRNSIYSVEGKQWKSTAVEWLHEEYCRTVTVIMGPEPAIKVEGRHETLREIDLEPVNRMTAIQTNDRRRKASPFVLLQLRKDYDLVLLFESHLASKKFLVALGELFDRNQKILHVQCADSDDDLLSYAETQQKRQKKLEYFFKEAYAKAFNFPDIRDNSTSYPDVPESVLSMTLTRAEFAEALGMRQDDLFVQRMFGCVARSRRDKISFQEFLGTAKRFSNDCKTDILKYCDALAMQLASPISFTFPFPPFHGAPSTAASLILGGIIALVVHLIIRVCGSFRSINEAAGVQLDHDCQGDLFDCLLNQAGVPPGKSYLSKKDFEAILADVKSSGRPVGLHLRGRKQTIALHESESLNSFAIPSNVEEDEWCRWALWSKFVSVLEDYRQHIIILMLFFTFTFMFFFERYWHYSQESEHRDLRRVMGVGIAVTRGAAAAMSFCFSIILLTVCRNVITKLRETPLNLYIPFDAAITFHKIVAVVGAVFAVIHTVGHCINFYHVATQSPEGLRCLFQEAVFSSDFVPSIDYWFFGTVTGITGILLVIVMAVIYVFAAPSIINQAYHAFRLTHFLNVLLYALTIAHGLPKLLDKPRFWYFIIVPVITFVIDRILTLRQDFKELQIYRAVLLPSDIIYIQCKRPRNFHFRSGQWVRVACPVLTCNFNERHAFSLASSPQDPILEMYIKAVGPWTYQLRRNIQKAMMNGSPFPVVSIDGPYGGGNQDWTKFEVAVLIGGGIGVSPYASILKDLVQSTSGTKHSDVACKKVYFLWICSSHKNFEFFVDVMREVEERDTTRVLDSHIFVTQFFHKFDLRTTMLFICENHFRCQKGRSMFTNLRAVNHFGRPNMRLFLKYVQERHDDQNQIGVFSCGPGSLNSSVRKAANEANRDRNSAHFLHRYETF